MIRKQVYLTEDLQRRIQIRSRMQQKPEARVIRELLDQALRHERYDDTIDAALKKLDALLDEHGTDTPADLSVRVDDYLYGTDHA
jgi:hypothetical protein